MLAGGAMVVPFILFLWRSRV